MHLFKTWTRTFLRNKTLSLINLFGLAIGISSCLLISLFLIDELSYDSYNKNLNRIFRVTSKFVSEESVDHTALSSSPLPEALKGTFPEVVEVVRFTQANSETVVKRGDMMFKENDVWKGDPGVFKVFSYQFLKGDPSTALAVPRKVVITESIARKYFRDEDPIGKTLNIFRADHEVSGVLEDLPSGSDLRFSILTSMDTADFSKDWFDLGYYNYILFDEKSVTSPGFQSTFEKKLNVIADEKINEPIRKETQTVTATLYLQPLNGLHFQPKLLYDTVKGNMQYVYILSLVAVLILFIGCLNYINFALVQSIERSKEVGIRKIVGASFSHLAFKYTAESFLLTSLALVVACVLAIFLMPFFNDVTGKNFHPEALLDIRIVGTALGILLVVGVLGGSYPAFYTSSIRALQALKGKMPTSGGRVLRKVSITTQFVISIGLIICTGVVYRQMSFIKTFDLGFTKDNVLVITSPSDSTLDLKLNALKNRLKQNALVAAVSLAGEDAVPGSGTGRGTVTMKTDGKEDIRMVNHIHVDEDYIPTLNIKLATGRNFENRENDFKNSVLVNEALVRMMAWRNPLEQKLMWDGSERSIIGVTRDFHYTSLHQRVEPTVIVPQNKDNENLFVALKGSNPDEQLSQIKRSWTDTMGDEPLVYRFLDETLNAQYKQEGKAMQVFTYFSALTVAISCLGLFGLSSLTIYQRKKEIGIRKVIGASFKSILVLFSREYLILIMVALAIASPVTWYIMEQWLQDFEFKTQLSAYLYVIVGGVVIALSLLVILLSITKISTSKPTDLIRE